jgi:hypothetical protein
MNVRNWALAAMADCGGERIGRFVVSSPQSGGDNDVAGCIPTAFKRGMRHRPARTDSLIGLLICP